MEEFWKKFQNKKGVDINAGRLYNINCRREQMLLKQDSGRIAQLGEHLPYKQRVTGSSPVVPTTILAWWLSWLECWPVTPEVEGSSPFQVAKKNYGQLAQSVEQRTENPRVPGSIPGLATIFFEKK